MCRRTEADYLKVEVKRLHQIHNVPDEAFFIIAGIINFLLLQFLNARTYPSV